MTSEDPTFPQFPELALELRLQIWQHALNTATHAREIPVSINHHPTATNHSCLRLQDEFCGQHRQCKSPVDDFSQEDDDTEIDPAVVSVFNGYFCVPVNTSTTALEACASVFNNLNLACQESRGVVLQNYPETMVVFQQRIVLAEIAREDLGTRYPPRLNIRCNPETDILFIEDVPSYWACKRHPTFSPEGQDIMDMYYHEVKGWFPEDPRIFANFRSMVSRFRNVACDFMYSEQPQRLAFEDVFQRKEFRYFIMAFESLNRLDKCMSIEGGEEGVRVWERVLRDVENMDSTEGLGITANVLNCDERYQDFVSKNQDGGEKDCCWVPQPRGYDGSWLFQPRHFKDRKWWIE